MNKVILSSAVRFVVLVFVQVFLLRNVSLYNISSPFVYILFILLLPFETPNWLLFVLAFIMGLTIDAFYNTPGLHASACVLIALVRIIFFNITVHRDGYDHEPEPTLSVMGSTWFFTYALIMTLVHHFFLFNIEVFRWSEIPYTIERFLFSSLFTMALLLITSFLFIRKKER